MRDDGQLPHILDVTRIIVLHSGKGAGGLIGGITKPARSTSILHRRIQLDNCQTPYGCAECRSPGIQPTTSARNLCFVQILGYAPWWHDMHLTQVGTPTTT